ncbi:MAG: hypothetical protein H6622_12870 [Halobacteriovoraceae bacterium]|nr:hypothetical protein [Halobacteriovoraceae bacterium]
MLKKILICFFILISSQSGYTSVISKINDFIKVINKRNSFRNVLIPLSEQIESDGQLRIGVALYLVKDKFDYPIRGIKSYRLLANNSYFSEPRNAGTNFLANLRLLVDHSDILAEKLGVNKATALDMIEETQHEMVRLFGEKVEEFKYIWLNDNILASILISTKLGVKEADSYFQPSVDLLQKIFTDRPDVLDSPIVEEWVKRFGELPIN